jgi:hypothetical protein
MTFTAMPMYWDYISLPSHFSTRNGFWIRYIWHGNGRQQAKNISVPFLGIFTVWLCAVLVVFWRHMLPPSSRLNSGGWVHVPVYIGYWFNRPIERRVGVCPVQGQWTRKHFYWTTNLYTHEYSFNLLSLTPKTGDSLHLWNVGNTAHIQTMQDPTGESTPITNHSKSLKSVKQ